jgi:hypothetical protein
VLLTGVHAGWSHFKRKTNRGRRNGASRKEERMKKPSRRKAMFLWLAIATMTGCMDDARSEIRGWGSFLAALFAAPQLAAPEPPPDDDPVRSAVSTPSAQDEVDLQLLETMQRIADERARPCDGVPLTDWEAAFWTAGLAPGQGRMVDPKNQVWDLAMAGVRRWRLQPGTKAFVLDGGHIKLLGSDRCELARAYSVHKDRMGLYQPSATLHDLQVTAACRAGEQVKVSVQVSLSLSLQTLQAMSATKGAAQTPSLRAFDNGIESPDANHFGQAFLKREWAQAATRPLSVACQWARDHGALPKSKPCLAARHLVDTLSTVPQTARLRALGVDLDDHRPMRLLALQFRPAGRRAQTSDIDVSSCFEPALRAMAQR